MESTRPCQGSSNTNSPLALGAPAASARVAKSWLIARRPQSWIHASPNPPIAQDLDPPRDPVFEVRPCSESRRSNPRRECASIGADPIPFPRALVSARARPETCRRDPYTNAAEDPRAPRDNRSRAYKPPHCVLCPYSLGPPACRLGRPENRTHQWPPCRPQASGA